MLTQPVRPPVTLTARDHKGLMGVATAAIESNPDVADYLLTELDRATVVDAADIPAGLVTMNSTVTYRDIETKTDTTVTLVFPAEANIAEKKISVLSPVGVALLGLRTGGRIQWPMPNGKHKQFEILTVKQN